MAVEDVMGRQLLHPNIRKARDPVCGMEVEVDEALRVYVGKEIHYFCCSECAETFQSGDVETQPICD